MLDNYNEVLACSNIFAAADEVNPAEALESARKARDAISQDKDLEMDSEGTMQAKGDKNSLNEQNVTSVKGGNDFAAQWYRTDPELWGFECREMKRCFPQAKLSMLKDDRVCWDITFPGIIDVHGNKHEWTFKFIYDSDHPHNRSWGGSIKVYAVKPSINELGIMARRAGRDGVPHLFSDDFGNSVICTAPPSQLRADAAVSLTAIKVAGQTVSWATHFMMGLTDDAVWKEFSKHPVRST
jgi:hypothetical protein